MELIQISAGRGPIECSWAVWKIFEQFYKAAKARELSVNIAEKERDRERDTYKSIILSMEGKNVSDFCSEWIGTVQWTAQSPFRPYHKRKNWFVSIKAIPVSRDAVFSTADVKIDTTRASGAGGQHVNKTEFCVRATHIPSKTVVVIANQRSQHQNKVIALAVLMDRVREINQQKQKQMERESWQNHNALIRGNPIKKFTG